MERSVFAVSLCFYLQPVFAANPVVDVEALTKKLDNANVIYYNGIDDSGLAHTTYWSIPIGSAAYNALSPMEQAKVAKMAGVIRSEG